MYIHFRTEREQQRARYSQSLLPTPCWYVQYSTTVASSFRFGAVFSLLPLSHTATLQSAAAGHHSPLTSVYTSHL